LLCLLAVSCRGAGQPTEQVAGPSGEDGAAGIRVTFAYNAQSGMASNQFSVWIEDGEGRYVATLFATRYTAQKGHKDRPESQPSWVDKAKPGQMDKQQIDAIAGATPKSGFCCYDWYFTDDNGQTLDTLSRYIVRFEATLRWDNYLRWSAVVEDGQPVEIAEERVTSATEKNRLNPDAVEWDMIRDLSLTILGQ